MDSMIAPIKNTVFFEPMHPAFMMLFFWTFILFVYYIGPVYLTPGFSFLGALFLLTHLSVFIVGSMAVFSFLKKTRVETKRIDPEITSVSCIKSEQNIIKWFLFIGTIGGILTFYNKISDLSTINLSSIAILRTIRAQSLLHGGDVHSGLLSALAFLIYPAGFVGLVASIIQYENISRATRIWLFAFVGTIFCAAIIAGGRSQILVTLLFMAVSCYIRSILGRKWLPKSRALQLGSILILLMFLVYSSFIWTVRAAESGHTANQSLQHAINVWGVTPKPYLLALSEKLHKPELTLSILKPIFYLIQSITVTEKILSESGDLPTLYGSYHVDVIAAALRLLPEGRAFLTESYEFLLNSNIYGYFTGAWGALFIDYGYFSLFMTLLWGVCAGSAWVGFKNNPNQYTASMYVFWAYTIFISFASPPFGFSNSFIIFIWFFIFYLKSPQKAIILSAAHA